LTITLSDQCFSLALQDIIFKPQFVVWNTLALYVIQKLISIGIFS
jgi:hypothetical protein